MPCETRQYELGNIVPLGIGPYLQLEDFFDQDDGAGTTTDGLLTLTFTNELAFETVSDPRPAGYFARQISHRRFLYWNEEQNASLPVGQVTPLTLMHHVETKVFTPGLLDRAFEGAITEGDMDAAGYVADADNNRWNPGLIQHYSVGGFYLPIRIEDPFGNSVLVDWDNLYRMAPVKTTDALGNTIEAEIDYRTLSPWRLTDPNENIAEAVTDGLGMVIATSVYEEKPGISNGDRPLDEYEVQFSDDPDNPIPNRQDVLENPTRYLQNATTFFFYDLEAWKHRGEPIQAVGLARETHVSDENGTPSLIQKTIAYTDGFGRELQTKLKVEDGPAWVKEEIQEGEPGYVPGETNYRYVEQYVENDRWLASGRTVYNNKEKPVKQYEPFYSASPEYEPEAFFATYGVTPVIHYDPLLRVIKADIPYKKQPDGSSVHVHSKVAFTPWQIKTYDPNDTILESEYNDIYNELSSDEKSAFDKAAAHANTPQIADLDTLGRQFLTTAVLSDTHVLETHTTFDITGKPLTVVDPRQRVLNETRSDADKIDTFSYIYDMTGQTLRTQSIDAGDDRTFANVMGNPVVSLDARGHRITATYDALHRPFTKHVQGGEVALDHTVEAMIYGETHPDARNLNMRGKPWKAYDPSGRNTVLIYDFKGQPLSTEKHIRTEYKAEADWTGDETTWDDLLDTPGFIASSEYDALGRVVLQTNPDESITRPAYLQSGKLDSVHVTLKGETDETDFVMGITYNAKGQREQITYGNGTQTVYTYEDTTFRLTSLVTTRTSDNKALQNISYVYDPVGNIVKMVDDSHKPNFDPQSNLDGTCLYIYDALYRLIEATGRENSALSDIKHPYKDCEFKQSIWTRLSDAGQLIPYKRTYAYDEAGNLTQLRHMVPDSEERFTRNIIIHPEHNWGLMDANDITPTPENIEAAFDANGNQIGIDHLAGIEWNYRDNIAQAIIIDRTIDGNPNDAEYYVYDASGQRVRKVKETWSSIGGTKLEEKLYLGNVEIKRRRDESSLTNDEERFGLHVMDDKERIAIVQYWTAHTYQSADAPTLETHYQRYQYGNHLGSASLELTEAGELTSYEEYFPYGGTAFILGESEVRLRNKEYRFCAKERDDSTGFYYHGARYYAPWMGRWMSADPAGPVDGLNLYVYVSGNPVRKLDPSGMAENDFDQFTEDLIQSETGTSQMPEDHDGDYGNDDGPLTDEEDDWAGSDDSSSGEIQSAPKQTEKEYLRAAPLKSEAEGHWEAAKAAYKAGETKEAIGETLNAIKRTVVPSGSAHEQRYLDQLYPKGRPISLTVDSRLLFFTPAGPEIAAANAGRTELAIASMQRGDAIVSKSVEALSKTRPDKVVGLDTLSSVGRQEGLSLVAHGSPNSLGGMSAKVLSERLKQSGFQAGRVELISCQTGCGTYAQQLSNRLGVPVRAPLGNVDVLSGSKGIPQVVKNNQLMRPGLGWKEFIPQGRIRSIITNLFGI